MAEEFQAEPPRPRKDWGDDVDDRPVKRSSEGMPVWGWVLIGVGALMLCLLPALLALSVLLFDFRAAKAPAPAPPQAVPAPAPVPEKEKAP